MALRPISNDAIMFDSLVWRAASKMAPQGCHLLLFIPCVSPSLRVRAGLGDSLQKMRLCQKKQTVTSEIRLQKDCGFHFGRCLCIRCSRVRQLTCEAAPWKAPHDWS